jgi:hypothetical protein
VCSPSKDQMRLPKVALYRRGCFRLQPATDGGLSFGRSADSATRDRPLFLGLIALPLCCLFFQPQVLIPYLKKKLDRHYALARAAVGPIGTPVGASFFGDQPPPIAERARIWTRVFWAKAGCSYYRILRWVFPWLHSLYEGGAILSQVGS